VSSDRRTTRLALHAVAEQIIAGHQWRALGTIRLTVRPYGFSSRDLPTPPHRLAVDGTDLVVGDHRLALAGSLGALAAAAGVACRGPEGVYPLALTLGPDDELRVDAEAAGEMSRAWVLGDSVLRAFGSLHHRGGLEPVLWPEHLDVAVSLDEVNYGVSPGDEAIPEPYAYVGPHRRRAGEFWNAPFGASLPMSETSAAALRSFFEEGRTRARTDPFADG